MAEAKNTKGLDSLTDSWLSAADEFQAGVLPGVSRTFALSIPQLPLALRVPVSNAYLLCRIADTIEDEPTLDVEDKSRFEKSLSAVVSGRASAHDLEQALSRKLSTQTLPAERDLIKNLTKIIEITRRLEPSQIDAIERCVSIMARGMRHFQYTLNCEPIQSLRDLDQYCYHVAGVVGEMLTRLFCNYSSAVAARADQLESWAVSFGQGLQMTNILKDRWEDLERGVCWLPQQIIRRRATGLKSLDASDHLLEDQLALDKLIGIAHAHLRNALAYCLTLPSSELEIRKFCAWAVMLAVQTLHAVMAAGPAPSTGSIKITRAVLGKTLIDTSACLESDSDLETLFDQLSLGLPMEPSLVLIAPKELCLSS